MKCSRIALRLIALNAMLACGSAAMAASDAADDLAKAPAAVQETIKKAIGDKKLDEFGKEILDGKVQYEAGWKEEVDHAAIVDESGKLIQTEVDAEVDKLPAPVTDTIKKVHADGAVSEAAMATTPEKTQFYSVDMKVGDIRHVLDITADGKLLADHIDTTPPAKEEPKAATDAKPEKKD